MGKLRFALVLLQKKVLSDNSEIISGNIFLQIKNYTFAVLNLKVKTRRNFTLEIVEQCDDVAIYSILFENEENNEFMKFINKYANNPSFSRDIQRIVSYIDKIKENGVLERYFRREGKPAQKIKAIPVEINKLRLYAIRLTDNILIQYQPTKIKINRLLFLNT